MRAEDFFHKFTVTTTQREKLFGYTDLLLQWNNNINLIGRSTAEDIWQRHILDSAALLAHIPDSSCRIADLGSGAGLPGVILAILSDNPITLIESSGKKATFLQEVKNKLGLEYTLAHCRIEKLIPEEKFDIITARAVAELQTLWSWSHEIRKDTAIGIFLKGEQAEQEFQALSPDIDRKITPHPYGQGHIITLQTLQSAGKI